MIRRIIASCSLLVVGACAEGVDKLPAARDSGPPQAALLADDAGSGAALLESLKPVVTLERKGQTAPAQPGYLYVGDALETKEDAEARVRFPGGRVVDLGPDGRFELKSDGSGLVLNVSQGLVLTSNAGGSPAQPLPGPSVELTIQTPFGFTKVGGQDDINLTLTLTDNGANVDVKVGSVDLVATDGSVTKIGAGQSGKLGPVDLSLEPVEVVINAAQGKGEVKKKDETRWSPLAKKPQPLALGDSFRVKGGHVVLQAPGGQGSLSFAPGSEVTMDKASKSASMEETGFDFKKGEVAQQSPLKSRLNLSGGVSLSADKASQYTLKRTKDGYELYSTAGDVKIERQGAEAATVFGGDTATIPLKGPVKTQDPPKEALALPSKSQLKVLQSTPAKLAITWDGEPDKGYDVEVATDPAYKQKLLSGVVHQRFVNVQPPPRGSLYWKVFDDGGREVAKGSASFAPEPTAVSLEVNRNEVRDGAADQAKTTIYYQDKPPAVTFLWDASADAVKYKVQVYKKGDLSAPVAEKVVPAAEGERLKLPDGALGEGDYLWSLKFLDAKGNELGGTGKMNKLFIKFDNAVPNLVIKSPKNGDPGGAKVRCVGAAPKGAKLQINGRPVSLDAETSRFDTEAAPMAGGLLVFRMVNPAGSEVYTVRRVRKGK